MGQIGGLVPENCQPRAEKSLTDLSVRQDPDDDFWLDPSGYRTGVQNIDGSLRRMDRDLRIVKLRIR
jgi:hypothetical protein